MINKDSKISLSYVLAGESLVKAGVYETAKVLVVNGFTDNEVFKELQPMRTIKRAEYSKATNSTTLGNSFVQMALEVPKKPEGVNYHRWLRTPMGKISQQWKRMSDEQKVTFHVEQFVHDMGGEEYSFEFI